MDIFGIPLQAMMSQLLLGLVNGSFYAMLSLGLAVIFGLLNVINFSHGALYMMGAFMAYIGVTSYGLNYWMMLVLAPLAGRPLEDGRVKVETRDVGELLREADGTYDAVLLDVDNGPEALTQEENRWLYGERGLASIRRALKPRGVVVVWSASPDRAFATRLKRAGFATEVVETPARGKGGGPLHTLFIGRSG